MPAAKNATSKKPILKTFYMKKPPLQNSTGPSYIEWFARKHFQMAGYWSWKSNRKNSNCLTTFARIQHCTSAILWHNNKLISEMCLLGFWWVWGLCALMFLLSSIRLFFMQWNHIDVLTFQIDTFLEQCSKLYLDATASILKHLRYLRLVQKQYFECKIWAKARALQHSIYVAWWQSFCPWVFSLILMD